MSTAAAPYALPSYTASAPVTYMLPSATSMVAYPSVTMGTTTPAVETKSETKAAPMVATATKVKAKKAKKVSKKKTGCC